MSLRDAIPAWLENFPSAEVRALDPARHTLIEASAGTGKTFAVEHLVLRLLMENPDWMPEEILLLSFTEKTAADLRARIRALLHRQVRPGVDGPDKPPIAGWSEEDLKRLRLLWTHADDLAVHTLHAFCQSSLRRDPLASDVLIRDEVSEDRSLADEALENLLRGAWARDPARLARLRAALGIGGGDGWRGKLIRPALAWHPWRGDRLDPEAAEERAPGLESEIGTACACLRDALARVNGGSLALGEYLSRLPGKNPEGNAFVRTARILETRSDGTLLLVAMVETFYGRYEHGAEKKGRTKAYKDGFGALLESTRGRDIASLAEWSAFATACDAALRLGLRVEEERALDALRLRAQAVTELREELAREKLRRGAISYDDMPANLVRALRKNPGLAGRIRRRYKACIVDEFQDTDPVQWEILERLCLSDAREGAAAALPLFLVGDPKQAIYGFRGGDLRTYLAARSRFRDMAAEGRAQGFGLEANFRSRRTLIEALNAVFAHPDWFGPSPRSAADPAWRLPPDSGDVAFTPARAGRADTGEIPRVILRDFREEGAEPPRKADVERDLRRWIAARIVAALEAGRPPSDIAVLVRKNAEGEAIERLLRRRGVPCRVKRRGGFFHGPPADALRLLLEWIEDAGDPDVQARILLLPFARRDAADLPQGRPARIPPLLAEWAALARAGRWPAFFDAVRRQGG
jgi:exodeoxyribonuclease V beta subunit